MRKAIGLVLAAALAAPLWAQEAKYSLTGANTQITFVGAKVGGKHDGGFKTVTGTAAVQGSDPTTAKIDVVIDVNSLYSDTEKLTRHLLSPDFFGAKTNPTAKFVTKKVEKTGASYTVTGDLTMNGKTKSLTFPAQITAKDGALTVAADFKINRHDWGISYGKGKINDDVALKVNVNAKK